MTVRDLIRSLYIACDGNLETPFLGICLSGGEAKSMQQYPSEYDERTGKVKKGTIFGYMNASIHKSAEIDSCSILTDEDLKFVPAIALKRGGMTDSYVGPKENIGKTIEI